MRLRLVLPPEGPELRCDSARTCSRLVSSFLAASNIAAAALIRIRRLINPCKVGANGIDTDASSLFQSEDIVQHRTPDSAWFHNVKDLHEWCANTVEPSATVAAPIAMNAKSPEQCFREPVSSRSLDHRGKTIRAMPLQNWHETQPLPLTTFLLVGDSKPRM
jgi:hypothetical protein